MPSQVVKQCSKVMAQTGHTIAFAESATAGRMSAEFALTPESGKILTGGLVCYDADIKLNILGVPKELIDTYTPESAEVTEDMAKWLAGLIKADIYVAVTGLITPGGSETEDKPVGTMFMHLLIKGKPVKVRDVFSGNDESIVLQSIDKLAAVICQHIE